MGSKSGKFRVHGTYIVFIMMILMVISCKKDLDNPSPVQPFPLPPLVKPEALVQNSPEIRSIDEVASKTDFPASKAYLIGSSLSGINGKGAFGTILEIGGVLWEIFDFVHTETRFDQVDEALTGITEQIDVLQSSIGKSVVALGFEIDNLSTNISVGDINTQIGYINTKMDDFMFYLDIAKAYSLNPTDPAMINRMNASKDEEWAWASTVYTDSGPGSIKNAIEQLYQLLCPTEAGTGDNSLVTYSKTIVNDCRGALSDSLKAMSAYKLLESYFLIVVYKQLEAATLQMNADNLIDSSGVMGTADYFWSHTVAPKLIKEADAFIKAVDYLVVNLEDYRNQKRFVFDMQFSDAGVAPNNMFFHPLARAQFISDMLYKIAGHPYPVIGGHLIVPDVYLTNADSSVTVTIGSNKYKAKPRVFSSILPYAMMPGTPSFHMSAGYNWRVYHFGTPDSDQDWPTSPAQVITVDDDPIINDPWSDTPWRHSRRITGRVKPMFYNPSDPSQKSETRNDSCSFEFGFYAGIWQWGKMYLSNDHIVFSKHLFYIGNFNSGLSGNLPLIPFAATSDKQGTLYYQTNNISIKNTDGISGTFEVTGKTSYTDRYYVIADETHKEIFTDNILPRDGGSLSMFATYTASYGMAGFGGSDLTVRIGTGQVEASNFFGDVAYAQLGDVISRNWHNTPGVRHTEFGSISNLTANKFVPGVEYYYQTYNLPSVTDASINLTSAFQFVYMGYDFSK